ncbi:hypothetical protein C9J85_19080 [Haloferax sp. wsp5]|nr:hypothetical protein C9J85_19080 [Haloferax sp. wsp5]
MLRDGARHVRRHGGSRDAVKNNEEVLEAYLGEEVKI